MNSENVEARTQQAYRGIAATLFLGIAFWFAVPILDLRTLAPIFRMLTGLCFLGGGLGFALDLCGNTRYFAHQTYSARQRYPRWTGGVKGQQAERQEYILGRVVGGFFALWGLLVIVASMISIVH